MEGFDRSKTLGTELNPRKGRMEGVTFGMFQKIADTFIQETRYKMQDARESLNPFGRLRASSES